MEQELDLYAIWQVLVKRWKLLVIIPLIAVMVSAIVSLFIITPQYTATTTLMVTRPAEAGQILYQDIQVSRQLVATYREIVHSRRVLEDVITNENLPFGVRELREKVDVEAVRDTELIKVDVTDPDPVLAREIANEVAAVFMEKIIDIMQVENVSIVDEAVLPGSPVSPRVPLNVAVALVVGLMGAFGLVFLLEYLDRTIKEPQEVQKRFDLPVIGLVPLVEGDKLFALSEPSSPPAEAFRTLRTNIQYSSIDKPVKSILITGANPYCGKTTMSANLAVTLARSGALVLLVDADLRRPMQHNMFNINSDPGLSSLIFKEEMDLNDVVRKGEHKNLLVMPSGPIPPYPAEMLASQRMKMLSDQFAKRFDYVIYDSPPIIAVTDAAILANMVDGTIFVMDYGRVKWEQAENALEQLSKVKANVIGAVINSVPRSEAYYNGYQYYYGNGEAAISRKLRRKSKKLLAKTKEQ